MEQTNTVHPYFCEDLNVVFYLSDQVAQSDADSWKKVQKYADPLHISGSTVSTTYKVSSFWTTLGLKQAKVNRVDGILAHDEDNNTDLIIPESDIFELYKNHAICSLDTDQPLSVEGYNQFWDNYKSAKAAANSFSISIPPAWQMD